MVPPSKLDPGPFEVHFREQSQGLRSHAAAHPDLADTVTVHGVLLHLVCQEEIYNPGRDVSVNPNENSILTLPLRPRPVAFALALDQTLNSPLNAVPAVSGSPLPLGLGVDHRMSSFKSSVSVL